ncbi:hypothetical protein KAW08_01555 [bacterium]|nr:hypothetical protein [bacterium]
MLNKKRIWGILLFLGLMLNSSVRVCSEEITYIPKDKMGDFEVMVDVYRAIRVKYKDVDVLSSFGEVFLYGKSDSPVCMFPYLDTPVLIKREDNRIEYTYQYSDPSLGFSQLNKVIITPERVVSSVSFRFDKEYRGHIGLHPIFFPREKERIIGKECIIRNEKGDFYKEIYPKEKKTWLSSVDTREITFNLEKIGKIRYSISSLNPSPLLCTFNANSLPTFKRSAQRSGSKIGIAGSFLIYPEENTFKPGYEDKIQLEIAIGKKAEEKAEKISRTEWRNDVGIEVRSKRPANLFFPEDEIKFDLSMNNPNSEERRVNLFYQVKDYDNKIVYKKNDDISLMPEENKSLSLNLPIKDKGIYSMTVKAKEKNKIVGIKLIRFAIISHPSSISSDKSFFGVCYRLGGDFKKKSFMDKEEETLSIAKSLGVKRARDGKLFLWKWIIENREGKFTFELTDRWINLFEKYGIEIWASLTAYWLPEWAKGERKAPQHFTSGQGGGPLPKDFSLWENYVYHLVKHLKGRIKYYEVLNEPNATMSDPEIYLEFLKATYDGVKRADPDNKVKIGGCGIWTLDPDPFSWLLEVIEDLEGYKYFDIITFHHYVSPRNFGPDVDAKSPEAHHYIKKMEKLLKVAKKYNLRMWNGENGWATTWEGIFPHADFQSYEKKLANTLVRAYILSKSVSEVEQFTWYAFGANKEGKEAKRSGGFLWELQTDLLGVGNNIRPHGAAYSNLASLLDGAAFKRKLSLHEKNIYGFLFERGDTQIVPVWEPIIGEERILQIRNGKGKFHYLNILGKEIAPEVKGEDIFVKVSPEPVYLVRKQGIKEDISFLIEKAYIYHEKPLKIIDIMRSGEGKEILVYLKNRSSFPLKVDKASLLIDNEVISSLEKINIPGKNSVPVRFKLKKEMPQFFSARVVTEVNGNLYEKRKAIGSIFAYRIETPLLIDGSLSDWKTPLSIELKSKDYVYMKAFFKWAGPDDLSVKAYFAYDKDNLYTAFVVKDDIFCNKNKGSRIWNGDSIQISLDTKRNAQIGMGYDEDDFDITIGLSSEGSENYRRSFGNKKVSPDGPIPGAKVAVKREGNITIYEASFPIKELYPLKAERGKRIGFNFIVNDDDKNGREGWIGMTGGIGEKKAPSLYRGLLFK